MVDLIESREKNARLFFSEKFGSRFLLVWIWKKKKKVSFADVSLIASQAQQSSSRDPRTSMA